MCVCQTRLCLPGPGGGGVNSFALEDIAQAVSACWKRYALDGRFGIACGSAPYQ